MDEYRLPALTLLPGASLAQLAACANVCGAVESVYRWQGAVESAREVMLILKTTAAAFPFLEGLIRSLHSYDTPEILATQVAAGSERYLSWVAASVATDFSSLLKFPASPPNSNA